MVYSVLCSSVCTVELLILCLVTGTPLFAFNAGTWLALLGLLLFPQLLGLFSLNFVLGRAPATAVSILLLLEAPVAALIAWLWLGQLPAATAWPGLLMIMLGVTAVVAADARRANPATHTDTVTDMDTTGQARGLLAFPQHPLLALNHTPGEDIHTFLWREAHKGRFRAVEDTIRRLENQAVRIHGAKSTQATHWIEVRAVVARIAADHALSARLWLTAARFHASSARRDLPSTRTCLDHAYQEWCSVTDKDITRELASALHAICRQDPYYSTDMLTTLDRHLPHKTAHSHQE